MNPYCVFNLLGLPDDTVHNICSYILLLESCGLLSSISCRCSMLLSDPVLWCNVSCVFNVCTCRRLCANRVISCLRQNLSAPFSLGLSPHAAGIMEQSHRPYSLLNRPADGLCVWSRPFQSRPCQTLHIRVPPACVRTYLLSIGFTSIPNAARDPAFGESMLAGSERILNWYLDFDLHPDAPPRVVTFCPVQPGNTFALADRVNWVAGENLTLLFCPEQVRVFRQAQLTGTFPWPANDRFDVNVARFFHRFKSSQCAASQQSGSTHSGHSIVDDCAGRCWSSLYNINHASGTYQTSSRWCLDRTILRSVPWKLVCDSWPSASPEC